MFHEKCHLMLATRSAMSPISQQPQLRHSPPRATLPLTHTLEFVDSISGFNMRFTC